MTTAEGEKERFSDVQYALDGSLAVATITRDEKERIVAYDLRQERPQEMLLAADFDPEDPLVLPGEILTRRSSNGIRHVVLSTGGHPYLMNPGLS